MLLLVVPKTNLLFNSFQKKIALGPASPLSIEKPESYTLLIIPWLIPIILSLITVFLVEIKEVSPPLLKSRLTYNEPLIIALESTSKPVLLGLWSFKLLYTFKSLRISVLYDVIVLEEILVECKVLIFDWLEIDTFILICSVLI